MKKTISYQSISTHYYVEGQTQHAEAQLVRLEPRMIKNKNQSLIVNKHDSDQSHGARFLNTLPAGGGVLLVLNAAAAVVFFPLLLPVKDAIALLNVPFLTVPVTGVGAGAGTGNGFSLIELYFAGELGTGSFLDVGARAIAV